MASLLGGSRWLQPQTGKERTTAVDPPGLQFLHQVQRRDRPRNRRFFDKNPGLESLGLQSRRAGGDYPVRQQFQNEVSSLKQSSTVNPFANSKYTIEKDLTNRMSIGYGIHFVPNYTTDPDLLQQQSQKLDLISDVQVSYHWFKNVYLKGDFDLPSLAGPSVLLERRVTIEPRWRFGWWGNTNKDKENPKSSQP